MVGRARAHQRSRARYCCSLKMLLWLLGNVLVEGYCNVVVGAAEDEDDGAPIEVLDLFRSIVTIGIIVSVAELSQGGGCC